MSFSATVPQNSDSPSIFPAQNQTNMSRLQTILSADHEFNLSAASNDGYHNVIHLQPQAKPGRIATIGQAYGKSVNSTIQLFYTDDFGSTTSSNVEYQITPTLPIRASVNFDGTGTSGTDQTIRSGYNVATVRKNSTGNYTINFTRNMPNVNYMVQVTGMRSGSTSASNGCVSSDNTYGNSVQTGLVKIQFFGQDNTPRDVLMGNVTIFSVT